MANSNPAPIPFEYGPALPPGLIRLIKLKNGPPGSKIKFELRVEERGGSEYRALSYTWGSGLCDHEAICNGHSLMITSNLHLALTRLRETEKEETYLWVDAICINQADPVDKSIQVRRMSTIYRDAAAVIVWLGEESDTTDLGLQLLSNLCRAFPSVNGEGIRSLYLDHESLLTLAELDKSGQLEKFGIPSDTTSAPWQAAAKILDAAWFGRRWILQEVASSKKCVFRIGSHESTPEIVLGGAYRIQNFPEFGHALDHGQRRNCDHIECMVQLLRMEQSSWLHESMADVLLETADFQSADPRDRIFAIIGCLESFPLHLVDCTKRLPEILTSVAMCESEEEEWLLSLLRGLCYVDILSADVPSWIPTWEFSSRSWLSLWNEIEEDAIDATQMETSVSEDKKLLRTRAIIFDQVSTISGPTSEKEGLPMAKDNPDTQELQTAQYYSKKCDWLAQCQRIAASASCPTDSADEKLERFLRCYGFGIEFEEGFDFITAYKTYLRLIALTSATQSGHKDPAQIASDYKQRCQQLDVHSQQPGLGADDEIIAAEYRTAMGALAYSWAEAGEASPRLRYGRRFFASEGGKISWVPGSVQPGDSLCVIFGFAMPFLVRKVKDAEQGTLAQYKLLGACYVHDHMDGEIFLNDKLERVTMEIV
ncbi:hypothetical protein FQN54_008107 [Arachnomyces sp. PD_36]|nr:hypothetical protein FQN54_008107 [Arachnomyces sp. PD_36]